MQLACNSMNAHAKSLNELVQLSLHESYCLPLLTYASAALSLSVKQTKDLNVCWNTVYRMVFKFNRWESVKGFINGLGRLNLIYLLNVFRVKFYDHLRLTSNLVLYDLMWVYFQDNCLTDVCLSSLFLTKHAAINKCHLEFSELCS